MSLKSSEHGGGGVGHSHVVPWLGSSLSPVGTQRWAWLLNSYPSVFEDTSPQIQKVSPCLLLSIGCSDEMET